MYMVHIHEWKSTSRDLATDLTTTNLPNSNDHQSSQYKVTQEFKLLTLDGWKAPALYSLPVTIHTYSYSISVVVAGDSI